MEIIKSKEPSIHLLRNDEDEKQNLFNFAVACITNYLELCFPGQIHFAPAIASDLINTRDDWRAADFINCFRFLRQRQDIEAIRVYGNTLTIPKMMELVSVYECERADAYEINQASKKGEINEKLKSLDNVSVEVLKKFSSKGEKPEGDKVMGRQFDEIQATRERTGKDVTYPSVAPDEKYFEGKQKKGSS